MLVGVVAGALFAVLSLQAHLLTRGGALAGGVLAAAIIAGGGLAWAVSPVVFFVSSSALSHVGGPRKRFLEDRSEKGRGRDVGQVLANGGAVGGMLLLIYAVAPTPLLFWGFVGAFAAAAADTWATEVGTLARGRPRSLRTGQPVPPGTSGAVSLAGTCSAVAGAALVGACALPFATNYLPPTDSPFGAVALVVLSGVLGSWVDSLVGAFLQARYWNSRTGALTERPHAEETPNRLERGWRPVSGDVVNAGCTGTGAALAMLMVGG